MSLKKLTTALIDLSGTIHIDNGAIPGSIEALKRSGPTFTVPRTRSTRRHGDRAFSVAGPREWNKLPLNIKACPSLITFKGKLETHIFALAYQLRSSSVKIKFVTNTTKESKATLHQRLSQIGFEIDEAEIFSSLTAARSLVEKTASRPFLMLSDDALNDFAGIPTDDPDTVVVGLAPNSFSYENLNKAFRLVIDGAPLVAINKARYFMRADGLALGPGPFVEGLEYAAGVTATVVGKPERTFFMEALELLDSEPGEAVMIGDDAGSDIDGAQKMGMRGILVKTGKYRPSDEFKISPAPSFVVDDFGAAVDLILNELTK